MRLDPLYPNSNPVKFAVDCPDITAERYLMLIETVLNILPYDSRLFDCFYDRVKGGGVRIRFAQDFGKFFVSYYSRT